MGAYASWFADPVSGGTSGNNADTASSYSTVQFSTKNDVLSLWFWGSYAYTCVGDTNGASSVTIFRLGS